jgi:hypothetical protein
MPAATPLAKKIIVTIKSASVRKVAAWPTAGVLFDSMQIRGHRAD